MFFTTEGKGPKLQFTGQRAGRIAWTGHGTNASGRKRSFADVAVSARTVTDVQSVLTEASATTDMNGDGVVNVVDLQFVIDAVLGFGATGMTLASFGAKTVARPGHKGKL